MSYSKDVKDYRRFGFGRVRSMILAFWDIPMIVKVFG